MVFGKLVHFFLFILCITTITQASLIFHRDTLHILSKYGREVSYSAEKGFKVDSVAPGINVYPCSLAHGGFFFASLGNFPTCPCCPRWSIGSSHPFYRSIVTNINLSAPLRLTDSLQFRKCDTSRSGSYCNLPQSGYNNIYIFSYSSKSKVIWNLLVQVKKLYLDEAKPTQTRGGDMGYPFETCENMLVVDLYLQTDGSTNFRGAELTPILMEPHSQARINPKTAENSLAFQLFNLQGRAVSFPKFGASSRVPRGCYIKKCGTRLNKLALVNP
jgi:hypothetical protein